MDSEKDNSTNVDIFIMTHKDFKQVVSGEKYKVFDNRKIDKSNYLLKDDFYSEIFSYFYIAENYELKDYVGFCHYRRYWEFMDYPIDIGGIIDKYGVIVPKPLKFNVKIRNNMHCVTMQRTWKLLVE